MKYDEHLSFDLPEGYEVNLETNSDEETIYVIYSGVYIDDDGTKKAKGRTRITTQKVEDLNYFEERAESDFDIRIGNYIREINHPFLNLIGLGGKVLIEHNGNCYGVYITKVSKEEELNENAEKIASELTDIINCMIIDGDIPNVKPIPATMIY